MGLNRLTAIGGRLGRPSEASVWGGSTLLLLLLAWEEGARAGIIPIQYSSKPSDILLAAGKMIAEGELQAALRVSLLEYALGLSLAILVGIPLGLGAGWYRRLNYVVDPYLTALYATPSLTLLPLLVLWFGIGIRGTSALVFLSAFFPLTINVMHGVKTVDAGLLKMASSFNADRLTVFRTVVLPGTVPFLVSGLRLAVVRGLIGTIVGEMYATKDGGLGFIIAIAGATLSVDRLFVGVIIVASAGVLSMGAIGSLEQRLQHWKPQARG